MSHDTGFAAYAARLRQFMNEQASLSSDYRLEQRPEAELPFNTLALALFALQFDSVPILRKLCEGRHVRPGNIGDWREIPALPTTAFKEFEVTSLRAEERSAVFHSSGTTEQQPSRHFHNTESLALYEASLLPWFRAHVLADWPVTLTPIRQPEAPASPVAGMSLIGLTPSPALAPLSSLAHMLGTIAHAFNWSGTAFLGTTGPDGAWTIDTTRLPQMLQLAVAVARPLAILGTAFNFVHLLDHLAAHDLRLQLPPGSRVMETGGYKGRSRTVPKAELHALITKHLGIPDDHIVCEYGMSELSSQAYDWTIGNTELETRNSERTFRFPPWARVQIISPETGREVRVGETGLIRVFDLANVRSVLAVQTEDLGVRREDGFELLGRVGATEPRGCSLMSVPASGIWPPPSGQPPAAAAA
ncbi:MAG: hypothetical protein HZA90_13690 [Verrucomicrobia bacterium]|nr:hypothetical protein [Verrucomicrobiota bacterium]